MLMTWLKRILGLAVVAALGYGGYTMIQPQPVAVDLATIGRGGVETTIDEEGETRVKDIYRISAPIAGKLERLTVQVGDAVQKRAADRPYPASRSADAQYPHPA